jgi:ribulose-bisphosphate carboxylase large chain
MTDRFQGTYLIESPADIASVAEEMAGEQSTATGTRIAAETHELVERHGARVERIDLLETIATPTLESSLGANGPCRRARLTLSWPMHNVGTSLPILLTTLLGNQTGMRRLTGIRLEHLALPAAMVAQAALPRFGITGTRELTGVQGRPLIGCIVKPNIGLTPEQTAEAALALAEGGVDFIKDDELIANPPYSPVAERARCVMQVLNDFADRTGKRVMYAFNISDEFDEMRRHHDAVVAHGGNCVMVNVNGVGLSGVAALRRHSQAAIHGHRAGWAALTRGAMIGMDFQPYQAMLRLAGVDHLHVSGLGGKFWEDAGSVLASAESLLTPLADTGRDDRAMPVFSGGSTVLDVAPTYAGARTQDMIYACGGGILSHPDGLAAGSRSMRLAWEAAAEGIDLAVQARRHPMLARAIEAARSRRAQATPAAAA